MEGWHTCKAKKRARGKGCDSEQRGVSFPVIRCDNDTTEHIDMDGVGALSYSHLVMAATRSGGWGWGQAPWVMSSGDWRRVSALSTASETTYTAAHCQVCQAININIRFKFNSIETSSKVEDILPSLLLYSLLLLLFKPKSVNLPASHVK